MEVWKLPEGTRREFPKVTLCAAHHTAPHHCLRVSSPPFLQLKALILPVVSPQGETLSSFHLLCQGLQSLIQVERSGWRKGEARHAELGCGDGGELETSVKRPQTELNCPGGGPRSLCSAVIPGMVLSDDTKAKELVHKELVHTVVHLSRPLCCTVLQTTVGMVHLAAISISYKGQMRLPHLLPLSHSSALYCVLACAGVMLLSL